MISNHRNLEAVNQTHPLQILISRRFFCQAQLLDDSFRRDHFVDIVSFEASLKFTGASITKCSGAPLVVF